METQEKAWASEQARKLTDELDEVRPAYVFLPSGRGKTNEHDSACILTHSGALSTIHDDALNEAVRDAVRQHKRMGQPLAVWLSAEEVERELKNSADDEPR